MKLFMTKKKRKKKKRISEIRLLQLISITKGDFRRLKKEKKK